MMNRSMILALTVLCASCGGGDRGGRELLSAGSASRVSAAVAPASAYVELLQQVYVAYFGRPADPSGLQYYAERCANANAPTRLNDFIGAYGQNPTVKAVIDAFGNSKESKDLYGDDIDLFVDSVYRNIFNREAEPAGKRYWVDMIAKGAVTRAGAALAIMGGAQSSDLQRVRSKIAAATAFSQSLQDDAQKKVYDGLGPNALVRLALAMVGIDTAPDAFVSQARGMIGVAASGATGKLLWRETVALPDRSSPGRFEATSGGLYVSSTKSDTVYKLYELYGRPAWRAKTVPSLKSWIAAQPYGEGVDDFDIYASSGDFGNRRWGLDGEYVDDVRVEGFTNGMASGQSTEPWIVDGQWKLRWYNGRNNSQRLLSTSYTTVPGDRIDFAHATLQGNPNDATVFVATGSTLVEYTSSGVKRTFTMPGGGLTSTILYMQWADNTLWVLTGDALYRLTDTQRLVEVTKRPANQVNWASGAFCVQSGNVYFNSGTAFDYRARETFDWIKQGTMPVEQNLPALLLQGAIGGAGIYCSDKAKTPVIYSTSQDGMVMRLYPLSKPLK